MAISSLVWAQNLHFTQNSYQNVSFSIDNGAISVESLHVPEGDFSVISVEDFDKIEITDEIKSQIAFDCILKVSLTLTYIEIQAKIVDTGYTLSKNFLKKDRATALPKFVKALIAIYEVAGK